MYENDDLKTDISADSGEPVVQPDTANPEDTDIVATPAVEADEQSEAESFDKKPEEFNDARPKIYRKHIALQIVLGILSAFAIWGSLWFLRAKEGIFTWIWVILFGVVFVGKTRIERSKNIYFKTFTLSMLFGMIGAIVLTLVGYWIFAPGTLQFFSNPS